MRGAYAGADSCSRSLLRAGTTGTFPVGRSGSSATVGTSAAVRPKGASVPVPVRWFSFGAAAGVGSSSALVRRMAGPVRPHSSVCFFGLDLAFFSSEWCLSELRVSVTICQPYVKNLPHEFAGRFFAFGCLILGFDL